MADISTPYTLSDGSNTVVFNNGTLGDLTDKYWITAIQGLDGPVIRAPVDLIPFGDGGLVHQFFKGPRRVVIDGMLLIESSRSQALCQTLRNDLVADLSELLDGILSPNPGTLTWTPAGQAAQTLQLFYEIGLSVTYSDNYAVANFNFGLVSGDPDPS